MELSFHHICKGNPDLRDRLKCAFYHQRMSIIALNKFTIIGLFEIYHILPNAQVTFFERQIMPNIFISFFNYLWKNYVSYLKIRTTLKFQKYDRKTKNACRDNGANDIMKLH